MTSATSRVGSPAAGCPVNLRSCSRSSSDVLQTKLNASPSRLWTRLRRRRLSRARKTAHACAKVDQHLAMTFVVSGRFSALTRATSQAPRQNVLDVNADAVPAQGGRCVDRRDGQFEEAPDREIADRERRLSGWGAAEQQLRDVAAIVHCRR